METGSTLFRMLSLDIIGLLTFTFFQSDGPVENKHSSQDKRYAQDLPHIQGEVIFKGHLVFFEELMDKA